MSENTCSHKYIETTEKKTPDGGYQSKVFHYKCHRKVDCEICGHCATDCPGHQIQPGYQNQGISVTDSRIASSHLNASKTGNVRLG